MADRGEVCNKKTAQSIFGYACAKPETYSNRLLWAKPM